MMPDGASDVGRRSAGLAAAVRAEIAAGRHRVGGFLPSLRELAGGTGCSRETVRRAMHVLEQEGLVAALPRSGYRVLARANDPLQGCPVAYLTSPADTRETADAVTQALQVALQEAAARRGWALLRIQVGNCPESDVRRQLETARAWGVLLDTREARIVELARTLHLPAVMVNTWTEESALDAVQQDNYRGGFLAARHLLAAGCRKIAWLGATTFDVHSRLRYAGALLALEQAGRRFAAVSDGEDRVRLFGALLDRKSDARPDGFLCLWGTVAEALLAAAASRKCRPERDFRMVGWCADALWETRYANFFGGRPPAPAITWSLQSMADHALARLAQRREAPDLEPLLIQIPTRLRPAT